MDYERLIRKYNIIAHGDKHFVFNTKLDKDCFMIELKNLGYNITDTSKGEIDDHEPRNGIYAWTVEISV